MSDPRRRAWSDIHGLLPAGRHLGLTSPQPRSQPPRLDSHGARPAPRPQEPLEATEAEGEDELAALTYPVLALRVYGKSDHMAALERRARLAYLRGGEDGSWEATGRPTTTEVQGG